MVSRLAAAETQLQSHLGQLKMPQDRSDSPSVMAAMLSSPAGASAAVAGGARSWRPVILCGRVLFYVCFQSTASQRVR